MVYAANKRNKQKTKSAKHEGFSERPFIWIFSLEPKNRQIGAECEENVERLPNFWIFLGKWEIGAECG